jgi:hypothetical protein
MLHIASSGFHFVDFFHPLRYWGYQFWSGIGSDISEITLVGIALAAFRRINCHSPWCWRIGHHPTADGHFKLCRRHHPDLADKPLSLEEIHRRHRNAKKRPTARKPSAPAD